MTTVPSYFFPPYAPHFVSHMTYVSPPVCTVHATYCQLYLPWWVVMNECVYVYMQKGMTAVHHAVRSGRLSALKVLLEDCQCQLDLKAEVSMCSSSAQNRCQMLSCHNLGWHGREAVSARSFYPFTSQQDLNLPVCPHSTMFKLTLCQVHSLDQPRLTDPC